MLRTYPTTLRTPPSGRLFSAALHRPGNGLPWRDAGYTNSLRRRCEAMSRTLTVTMMMIRIAEVAW
jgi:hypothetical protein